MTVTTAPSALALPAPYGSCPYDPPPGYTAAAARAPVSRSVLPDGTRAGSSPATRRYAPS
ncbi:hypothetical protein [Streptomyces sp. NPDC058622]|uniref:hypothetical protein n=1 Tax=unclassified Streptomyces TaxID=2593676 RepID=UPI00365F5ECF